MDFKDGFIDAVKGWLGALGFLIGVLFMLSITILIIMFVCALLTKP